MDAVESMLGVTPEQRSAWAAAPVAVVRDPAALREARRRKSEKAWVACPQVKAAEEVSNWTEHVDSWSRSFWTEPVSDADAPLKEKVFTVEFKRNAAVVLDWNVFDPDAY